MALGDGRGATLTRRLGVRLVALVTVWLDALLEYDLPSQQRALLFQYASRGWFDMQPIFRRASHLMTCLACGKFYIEHPLDMEEAK